MLLTKSGETVSETPACLRGGECGRFVEIARLRLDRYDHEVQLPDGKIAELSRNEFRLLEILMRNAPRGVAEDVLMLGVWKIDFDPGTNRLAVLVNLVREKIGARRILTIRAFGYRLSDEFEEFSQA